MGLSHFQAADADICNHRQARRGRVRHGDVDSSGAYLSVARQLSASTTATVLYLCVISGAASEPSDALDAVNKFQFPIPNPSFVTTPQRFSMSGNTYAIP